MKIIKNNVGKAGAFNIAELWHILTW